VVETHDLEKSYGRNRAIASFDMHVEQGDIYGLVGSNGAGKSTVLKMLCGLTTPTAGEIVLFDGAENARERIGALVETPGLHPDLSAYQNLMVKALALGMVNPKPLCNELLDLVGISNSGKQRVSTLSLGVKQRLGIALTLVGYPDLLLLDEPLSSLDPRGTREMRELFLHLVETRGMTIVISSHVIDQLNRMATRYGVIRNGTMIRELSARQLREERVGSVRLHVLEPERAVALLKEHAPRASVKALPDDVLIVSDCDEDEIAQIMHENGLTILELTVVRNDIEDYFINLMEDGMTDD